MIVLAWTIAAIVSLAPIFGWKDPQFAHRVLYERKCLVSQDVAFQIFATISTYYAPLVVLLLLYWRVFQVSFLAKLLFKQKMFANVIFKQKLANAALVLPDFDFDFDFVFVFALLYLRSNSTGCKVFAARRV